MTRSLLGRVALAQQLKGETSFSSSEVTHAIPIILRGLDANVILEEVAFATGLLKRDGANWRFTHQYFQDFFCANHLVERMSGIVSELKQFKDDNLWLNVWRQVGQLSSDPETFAQVKPTSPETALASFDRLVGSLLADDALTVAEAAKLAKRS